MIATFQPNKQAYYNETITNNHQQQHQHSAAINPPMMLRGPYSLRCQTPTSKKERSKQAWSTSKTVVLQNVTIPQMSALRQAMIHWRYSRVLKSRWIMKVNSQCNVLRGMQKEGFVWFISRSSRWCSIRWRVMKVRRVVVSWVTVSSRLGRAGRRSRRVMRVRGLVLGRNPKTPQPWTTIPPQRSIAIASIKSTSRTSQPT